MTRKECYDHLVSLAAYCECENGYVRCPYCKRAATATKIDNYALTDDVTKALYAHAYGNCTQLAPDPEPMGGLSHAQIQLQQQLARAGEQMAQQQISDSDPHHRPIRTI